MTDSLSWQWTVGVTNGLERFDMIVQAESHIAAFAEANRMMRVIGAGEWFPFEGFCAGSVGRAITWLEGAMSGDKIAAIKLVRAASGGTLRECKDGVETLPQWMPRSDVTVQG